ncbi:hypothetical protein BKA56DRAFT_677110 [Ilyonectria sp. MPI-CAGE-AT-0026]|nr:hypothetical protein BKA56DRAFT_677110 [Ilyonectria sp. MPI-CAGE-AT-0026]
MASLTGKVIALSGAASGIGLATAKILYERGASLALCDIRKDVLEKVAAEVSQKGVAKDQKMTLMKVDVSNTDDVNNWIDQAVKDFGRLDGAANIAGTIIPGGLIGETPDEEWERVMRINSTGMFKALRAQLPRLSSGGSVVNISSMAGLAATPNMAAYGASKHAVIGLTRTAAVEYGPKGIRVNSVAPGVISTPLANGFLEGTGITLSANRSCLKRVAEPEEVGRVVAFLLSDDSSYMSGVVVNVDAGFTVGVTVDN